MAKIRDAVRRLVKDESGATAVEYGLMVALIAAVIITAVTYLGTSTSTKFSTVANAINNPTQTAQ
jgi:pilus assembly protein Flp/PilA